MLGCVTSADRVMCPQDATTARGAASQAQAMGLLCPLRRFALLQVKVAQ